MKTINIPIFGIMYVRVKQDITPQILQSEGITMTSESNSPWPCVAFLHVSCPYRNSLTSLGKQVTPGLTCSRAFYRKRKRVWTDRPFWLPVWDHSHQIRTFYTLTFLHACPLLIRLRHKNGSHSLSTSYGSTFMAMPSFLQCNQASKQSSISLLPPESSLQP